MVQIVAPESASSAKPVSHSEREPSIPSAPPSLIAGDEDVDSQELTQDEFSEVDELGRHEFEQPVVAPPMVESPLSTEAIAKDDDSPNPQELPWTPAPSQNSRQKLLIGAAALGLLSSLSILGFWLLGGPGTTPMTRVVESRHLDDQPEVGQPISDDSLANEPLPSEMNSTDATTADSMPVTPVSSKGKPTETIPEQEVDIASPMIPNGLLPVDPLGDPSGNSGGPMRGEDEPGAKVVRETDDEPAIEPLMGLPPELEAFTRLLDVPGNAPDRPPLSPDDNQLDELQVEQAADVQVDPMMLATPPPAVNINNALTYRVAISSDGYPLNDLLLLVSEVTLIPIQVDWVTLDLAGVSISQKVKDPKPGGKAIGDLLSSIASEVGIELERQPDRLLVTLSIEEYKSRLKGVLSTKDFGNEQLSGDELIDAFVQATDWDEREKVGLRALITESLRRARSLPTQLSSIAIDHWTVAANCLNDEKIDGDFPSHWPLVDGGDSGPQLDTAITLAGFLRHTARLNQSTCLVNWQDARDHRLSPGQLVMPFAGDPAGKMLGRTLSPLGLSARQASPGVWWVGTDATYDRMPLLVIGDALGPRRVEILQRLGEAAQKTGTEILLQHDPVSDRYLSLMPRFLYRQLPTILDPFR